MIFAIAAMSVYAQAQQRGVPKPTKADAEQVVQIIRGDKVKTHVRGGGIVGHSGGVVRSRGGGKFCQWIS